MSKKLNERPIPSAALSDPDAVEMLRVWIAERRLHCSMKVGMYLETTNIEEETAWGKILADAAAHIAKAMNEGYGHNQEESINKIRTSFLSELDKPTTKASGNFVQKH